MIPLLADHSLSSDIVAGLRRRLPQADILRAIEVQLHTKEDPGVLEWAAKAQRVLLTSDQHTMIGNAWDRVIKNMPMPGVIYIDQQLSIGNVIEELVLISEITEMPEWKDVVKHLPSR